MQSDDFDKQLTELWQRQETPAIDAKKLTASLSRMRWKQLFYVCLDFGAVILAYIVMFSVKERFSATFFYGMLVFISVSGVFAGYLLYLRRHVLKIRFQSKSTSTFLQVLIAQTHNNARIAWITKHSCWASWLMLLIFWLIIGRYDDMPHDEWQRKTIISAVLGFLLFIPMWFWAAWRERKFIRQEQDLKQQLAQLSGTSGQMDR